MRPCSLNVPIGWLSRNLLSGNSGNEKAYLYKGGRVDRPVNLAGVLPIAWSGLGEVLSGLSRPSMYQSLAFVSEPKVLHLAKAYGIQYSARIVVQSHHSKQ